MTSEPGSASRRAPDSVHLPAPTAWPLLLALGMTLVAAGFVTRSVVSLVGAVIAMVSCFGWFLQVLPHERHEAAPVVPERIVIATSRPKVGRIEAAEQLSRARLPLEIYPVSAGVKGGLAGGVAMAALAMLYGILSQRSIWYPINLLGAVVYAQVARVSTAQMDEFHIELLAVATLLHVTTCVLVGLLYGAILPMLPRRPILLGGVLAPLVWTGLLYNVLGIVDPLLNQRIHWGWFLASQIAFGIVAGLVVLRQVRVPTWQYPLAVRAGIETSGLGGESGDRDHSA